MSRSHSAHRLRRAWRALLAAAAGLLVLSCTPGSDSKAEAARRGATVETAEPTLFFSRADFLRLLQARRAPAAAAGLEGLERRVREELSRGDELARPYAGRDLNIYLQRLTHEHRGAAAAAADLATYAYLVALDQGYGSPQLAREARSLARRILVSWASGALWEDGRFLADIDAFFSTEDTPPSPAGSDAVRFAIALQLGRGAPYWAEAQDLLQAQGALTAADQEVLSSFLHDLSGLVGQAQSYYVAHVALDCNRYNNASSVAVSALVVLAVVRQDRRALDAYVRGSERIAIPWNTQMERAIYGSGERPLHCATTQAWSQINTVAPGEVVDRYRAGRFQTFGYVVFALNNLALAARAIERKGYAGFSYVGPHGESLKSAADYYAYYVTRFASDDVAAPPGAPAQDYPSYAQYAGKAVSGPVGETITGADGVAELYLIAHAAYPEDQLIAAAVDRIASFRSAYRPFSRTDPLYLPYLAAVAAR